MSNRMMFYVQPETEERIRALAEKTGKSMSAVLKELVDAAYTETELLGHVYEEARKALRKEIGESLDTAWGAFEQVYSSLGLDDE